MKKLFIYALTLAAPAAFAISSHEVCLYEHNDYKGESVCYSSYYSNSPNISSLGNFNDRASSILLGSNSSVQIFQHNSFGGDIRTFSTNQPSLGNFNDHTSSFKIIPKSSIGQVCIYENANYQGVKECWSYNGTDISIPWLGNFNDKASSVTMPPGVKITGYENGYYGGQSWSYSNGDVPFLASGDNDKWSAIKLSKP
jgi:hypothetical protein